MVKEPLAQKRCPNCLQALPLSAFVPNKSKPGGTSTYCRPCQRAYQNRTRQAHQPEEAVGLGIVRSHAEVAQILGISRSMVQKIEAQALRKLRRKLARRWGAPVDGEWALETGGAR